MSGETWVRVEAIKGGQVVFCMLCGKNLARRFFMASDTNYAEALRLAIAYDATHRMSEMHKAAEAAFHSDELPPLPPEEALLAKIFGTGTLTERDQRRDAARRAAAQVRRQERYSR